MRHGIAWLRSVAFVIIFYGGTVPWVLAALAVAPLGEDVFRPVVTGWSRFHRLCARWLLGQRVVIEGEVPANLQFCVLKHEAMFETLDLPCVLPHPTIAAKQELLDIPFWGRAARAYGVIGIDRNAGAGALRRLRVKAKATMESGRVLCIFPEGTRVPHGAQPPLKSGFAGLYAMLGVPVVPVALDSGRLNRRGRFIRYPGVIRYRFGPVVPPGLDRREAEARVHRAINALNADQP